MKYGFGVDLGGTTVKIAFFDETGLLLDKWEIPTATENHGAKILPDIAQSIKAYVQTHNVEDAAILGIGMGVPGPVSNEGVVHKCVNLGWGVFNVHEEMNRLTGYPVKAGNDATVAALGECWKGGGQGCNNMVFITLGTGVGGGIVTDGNLLFGANGAAAEVGHMVLNREETEVCSCGKRGCVEQYCSATGVVRLAKKALAESDTPSALRGRELTCRDVFMAGKQKDVVAGQVLEQVYAYMGEFLANICNVVNPQRVVLGGGVSRAGAPLLEGIGRHFGRYVFHACANVEFSLAELGNDAGAYGAFRLILNGRNPG